MAKQAELPGPVPSGLVVCQSIAQDLATNKVHLLGLGSKFALDAFPGLAEFGVYAVVTNVRQDCVAYFDVVDWQNERIARSDDLPLTRGASLGDDSVAATVFRNVLFPNEGDFFVRFMANRKLVMEKRIMLRAIDLED